MFRLHLYCVFPAVHLTLDTPPPSYTAATHAALPAFAYKMNTTSNQVTSPFRKALFIWTSWFCPYKSSWCTHTNTLSLPDLNKGLCGRNCFSRVESSRGEGWCVPIRSQWCSWEMEIVSIEYNYSFVSLHVMATWKKDLCEKNNGLPAPYFSSVKSFSLSV